MSQPFSVIAIIAAYNEADIIGQVVADLIKQGVQVYFIDDQSTDATVSCVQPFVGKGVLAIEHLGLNRTEGSGGFRWGEILARKEQLAAELDADWFIHHDADEFRESPWEGLRLVDAIRRVDEAGFNAIDFVSLDFWPSVPSPMPIDDVRRALPSYAPSLPHDRIQVRCWKRAGGRVDLVSSGGHDALFSDRQVFPVRFVLRHYPVRGERQGRQKIFAERRGRYLSTERSLGWHVQYDELEESRPLVGGRGPLRAYDPDAVRLELLLRHRGVEALEDQVRQLEACRAALQQDIERVRTENRQYETAEAERALLQERVGALEHERVAQAVSLEALRAQVSDLSAELDLQTQTAGAEFNDLEAELHDVAKHADECSRARQALANRLNEVEHSRSWRWTAIFRKLANRWSNR